MEAQFRCRHPIITNSEAMSRNATQPTTAQQIAERQRQQEIIALQTNIDDLRHKRRAAEQRINALDAEMREEVARAAEAQKEGDSDRRNRLLLSVKGKKSLLVQQNAMFHTLTKQIDKLEHSLVELEMESTLGIGNKLIQARLDRADEHFEALQEHDRLTREGDAINANLTEMYKEVRDREVGELGDEVKMLDEYMMKETLNKQKALDDARAINKGPNTPGPINSKVQLPPRVPGNPAVKWTGVPPAYPKGKSSDHFDKMIGSLLS